MKTYARVSIVAVILALLIFGAYMAFGTADPHRVGHLQHSGSIGPPTPVAFALVSAGYPLKDDHHRVGKIRRHHRVGDKSHATAPNYATGPNDWCRPAWLSGYRKNPPTGIIQVRANTHIYFCWNTLHNTMRSYRVIDLSCEVGPLVWQCDSQTPRVVKGHGRTCDLYFGCWDYVYRRWTYSYSGSWCVDGICGGHHTTVWIAITARGNGKVVFDSSPTDS